MGETDRTQPPTSLPPPPPPLPLPHNSAPVGAPPAVDYLRFAPAQAAGWTTVASFGTAQVWHMAHDMLVQQHIVCRMVADPRPDAQRMDLLVMASEAEWARELLSHGIAELRGTVLPAGGFPVVMPGVAPPSPQAPVRQQGFASAAGARAPLAALPVGPLRRVETPGQSAAYTITLVLLIAIMVLLIISMVAVCFMRDNYQ